MEQASTFGIRPNYRIEGSLIVAWTLMALLFDVAWDTGSHMDFVFGYLIHLAYQSARGLLWAGIAGIATAIAVLGHRNRSRATSAVLLLSLAAVGAVHGMEGPRIGRLARFHMARHRYQAVVTALASGGYPGDGPSFKLDDGPPLRVAFPLWQHPMDHWCGIVYDPTGLAMKVGADKTDRSDLDDPMLEQARFLFGGVLYACEPLGGPWYYCWST